MFLLTDLLIAADTDTERVKRETNHSLFKKKNQFIIFLLFSSTSTSITITITIILLFFKIADYSKCETNIFHI